VLDRGYLHYYTDVHDKCPRGVLSLKNCTVEYENELSKKSKVVIKRLGRKE